MGPLNNFVQVQLVGGAINPAEGAQWAIVVAVSAQVIASGFPIQAGDKVAVMKYALVHVDGDPADLAFAESSQIIAIQ